MTCTYTEGRLAPRKIIQIMNEFLATVYFVKFHACNGGLFNSFTVLRVHLLHFKTLY